MTLAPQTSEEVREAVVAAITKAEPLEVLGGGTKRTVSEPSQAAASLDLTRLCGIITYEPEELVLTARPGTSLAELDAALAEKGQMLAFEPPSFSALLGADGQPTLGGAYASNLSGPRRLAAGAVRDHVLGIEAVAGRGEIFRAGGRVVKNVTGYDLARALAGSWGTLAVATELTLKTAPRPERQVTVMAHDLSPREAVVLMTRATGSPADVTGAAHVPAETAADLPGADGHTTALRLEGFGPSVAARQAVVEALVPGRVSQLTNGASEAFWRAVRDASPFREDGATVWRCSVAPTAGPAVAEAAPPGSRCLFDWAGGLVWIAIPAASLGPAGDGGRGATGNDGGAHAIRAAIAAVGGGHATLMRAPAAVRAAVPTFHPPAPGLRALSERLRQAFDPDDILNPGRMARTRAS